MARAHRPNLRHGQLICATSPQELAGLNPNRVALAISNLSANPVFVGVNSNVSDTSGYGIGASGYLVLETADPIYVVSTAGGEKVTFMEEVK